MNRAIYPILSGALAQERRLQVFANNIANVNTAGFKQDQQVFKAVMARRIAGPPPVPGIHTIGNHVGAAPAGHNERVYTAPHVTRTNFDIGRTRMTGNPLDLAIQGDGFFELKTPQGTRYTRTGMLSLDTRRRLVTSAGFPVLGLKGEIKIPPGNIQINSVGGIQVDGQTVGTIKVVQFDDNSMPGKSEDGLFMGGAPKVMATPMLQPGHLEESNVNSLGEMVKLIEGMRTYESAQKMIQTIDHMSEVAIQEVGRVL
ncbi:MAG TPA: flagellar hook-basal body protein [Nitrospira sp.]|nr:flagellar hook-basal body protein [Nitrospira sp.]